MNRLDLFNAADFIAKKQGKKKTLDWSQNEMNEVFNNGLFSPSKQKNYYTTFNNRLYNPDEFKKYWSSKKNIKGIYKEDLDNDGIDDYIAVNNLNRLVGFNNQIILDKENSLYPYQRNYYEKDKDYRSKYSFNQFLEEQKNKEGYRDIEKSVKRRKNQAWYRIYDIFIKSEELKSKTTPKKLEAAAKKIYELGKYVLKPKELDSSAIEPLLKKALFKEIYENTIESYEGGYIYVFNLTPETVLYWINNKFNGFKEFCSTNELFDKLRLTQAEVQSIYKYYEEVDKQTAPAYRKDTLDNAWYKQALTPYQEKPEVKVPRRSQLTLEDPFNYNSNARNKKFGKKFSKKLAKPEETLNLSASEDD